MPATIRPAPSNDLLDLLAALSKPQHTPTPDFLCPYPLQQHPAASASSARRRRSARRASTSVSPITTALYFPDNSAVPPKYIRGDDGKWYTREWSLHGRTSSPTKSTSSPSRPTGLDTLNPTAELEDDDDDKSVNNHTGKDADGDDDATYKPQNPAVDLENKYDDLIAALPTGWKPPPQRTKFYSAPVIIVLSLVLAIVVTLVITWCVLSHKTRRSTRKKAKRKLQEGLETEEGGHEGDVDYEDEERDVEKEGSSYDEDKEEMVRMMKSKKKKKERMWERWRRQGQKLGLRKRRRKGLVDSRVEEQMQEASPRPSFASSRTQLTQVSVVNDDSSHSHSHTRTRSRSRTPIPPVPPLPSTMSSTTISAPLLPSAAGPSATPQTPPPPSTPPPALPPAYRRQNLPADDGADADDEDDEILGPDAESSAPLRGHVATDDKAVLERMRMARSAPIPDVDGAGEGVAVPVWEDEMIEDFVEDVQEGTSRHQQPRIQISIDTSTPAIPTTSSTSLLLPPPPSSLSLSPSTTSLLSHSHSSHSPLTHSPSPRSPSPLTLPPPPNTHLDLVQRHLERQEDAERPYYVPVFPGVVDGPSAPSAPEMDADAIAPSAPPMEFDEDEGYEYAEMEDNVTGGMMEQASAPPLPSDSDFDDEDRRVDEDERRHGEQDSEAGSQQEETLIASCNGVSETASSMERRPRGRERHDPLQGGVEGAEGKRVSTASLPRYEP